MLFHHLQTIAVRLRSGRTSILDRGLKKAVSHEHLLSVLSTVTCLFVARLGRREWNKMLRCSHFGHTIEHRYFNKRKTLLTELSD